MYRQPSVWLPDETRNPPREVWLRRTQVTLENQILPNFNLDANGCDVESLNRMSESSLALGSSPWRVTLSSSIVPWCISLHWGF